MDHFGDVHQKEDINYRPLMHSKYLLIHDLLKKYFPTNDTAIVQFNLGDIWGFGGIFRGIQKSILSQTKNPSKNSLNNTEKAQKL